jgi:heme exporter protein C
MYLHVPAAWVSYLAYSVTAACSVLYLVPRTRSTRWDAIAGASAEVGVVFTALTILEGSLWARPIWGIWWTWDARLVTTAVLFFLFLGYLALRRAPGAAHVRAKRSSIVAVIAFADVPVVHLSVIWWRTLHQQPTVLNPELAPQIHGVMLATLILGVVVFTVTYVHLLLRRYALARAEDRREELLLAWALADPEPDPLPDPADRPDPLAVRP